MHCLDVSQKMPIGLSLISHKRSNTSFWFLVLFLLQIRYGYNSCYTHLNVHILGTFSHIEQKTITIVSSKKMHYRLKPFFCLLRLVSLPLAFLKNDITLFTKQTLFAVKRNPFLNNCAINLQNNQLHMQCDSWYCRSSNLQTFYK